MQRAGIEIIGRHKLEEVLASKTLQGALGHGVVDIAIWSGEHNCWWRDNGAGYVMELAAAGVYSFEEAFKRCDSMDPSKRIEFVVLKFRLAKEHAVDPFHDKNNPHIGGAVNGTNLSH